VSYINNKENANMKLIKVTFAVSVLAMLALLSGCIMVPVGPGYYSHGHNGSYGSNEGRGGHGYR
jgi:hypothetical protein